MPRARFGPILAFSLAGGALFGFAAGRWGVAAGSVAAGAWVLQPNLFGHGHYATLDGLLAACAALGACSGSSTPTPALAATPVPVNALAGSVINFGDSITCGDYASPLTDGYASLLDPNFKGTATNFCREGDQVADMLWAQVYPNADPTTTGSPTYTVMIGTNDAQYSPPSTNPGYLSNYTQTLSASLAWLALPHTDKIFGQSSAVTKTGSWTPLDAPMAGVAVTTSAVGDTLQFPVTQTIAGRHLYLGWHVRINDGGSANLFIDGQQVDTLYTSGNTGAGTETNKFNTDQVFVRTYPLGAVGQHTILLRTIAGSAATNTFGLYWAGVPSADYTLVRSPRVLAGGVLHFQNNANDADTGALDSAVQTMVTALFADGLDVEYVPTRAAINTTSDMFDLKHPNNIGHQKLAAAFLAPLQN